MAEESENQPQHSVDKEIVDTVSFDRELDFVAEPEDDQWLVPFIIERTGESLRASLVGDHQVDDVEDWGREWSYVR